MTKKLESMHERTEEELQLQARGLCELRDLCNDLEIPYFVSGGTLLGIIREGDFIRWDWDSELNFRFEEFYPRRAAFISEVKKRGFQIVDRNRSPKNYKLNVVKYNCLYDLLVYEENGKYRQRLRSKIPAYLFQDGHYVTLRGEKYQALYPPEEYLEYNYGDWKIPKKTMDKSIYVTTDSRNKLSMLSVLRNIIQM